MRSTLFETGNPERPTPDQWTLQSPKMLRCTLDRETPEIISAAGAMVAYQGEMDFAHQCSGGGLRLVKKMASGEGGKLMRTRGQGVVFYARRAHDIFLIMLDGDALTLNTQNLLAFDATVEWDITTLAGAGLMAGGLFNLYLQGHGMVAVTADGPPLVLDCSQQPTCVDPQAAVCWSANLQPRVTRDFTVGSLLGRGSGESFHLAFHGPGFVVVQPSEGVPVVRSP